MAYTHSLLSSTTVGSGGTTAITFNNIPQNYTDLKVVLYGRGSRTGNNDFPQITFNGTTTNYSMRALYGSGTASSFTDTRIYGYISSNPSTTNAFGNMSFYMPNYTSSNFKPVTIDSVSESNSTTTDQYALVAVAGLWSNVSPITSIKLQLLSGTDTFLENSKASLYGIRVEL